MLSCFLTSSMRCRTPLSGFSESNLSALFMLPGLIKYAKVLLMYLAFLLFEFLVSSLFCIAIHSLRNAFTFPSFQSSSLLDKFSLLLVFEALFKTFVVVSSKVTLNYLQKQYLMDYWTPNNLSILRVHPQNVYLHCLMEGGMDFFSPKNHMLVV